MKGLRGRIPVCALAAMLAGGWATTSAAYAQGVTAASSGPTPAYYTFQAPGGASTAGRRVIALTFDDGPGPYTPAVLATLERYHVPATFFEIGVNTLAYPQYTKMLADAGYPVENHTWTHADLATLPVSAFPYQIDQTQTRIHSLTGITPTCVRPPYDALSYTELSQIAQRGLTTMSYSIDPRDWMLPGTQTIVARVLASAFPGGVVDLHDAGGYRQQTVDALPGIITGLEARGYTFVSICGSSLLTGPQTGDIFAFGSAPAPAGPLNSNLPFVGAAQDPSGSGYWLAAADGGVFTSGPAGYFGSMGGHPLNQPVVAIAATPGGRGYWLAARDGGIFTFGNAGFSGSMGGSPLNQPVVGMAADPATGGYWLVAADGGVFSFNAPFLGSMGGTRLNQPIVGMAATPSGKGYWLVAADGGIFTFGDAAFLGSMGGTHLNSPVVGMAADSATGGYWLVAGDGGVFSFDAPFLGSRGSSSGADRYFAIAAAPGGAGYILAGQHPQA